MAFGKGFWPSLWFIQGVVEVIFAPGSGVAWVFLMVATAYWLMKLFQNQLSRSLKLVLGVLTAMLWIISSLFLF